MALSDAQLVRTAQGGDVTSLGILLERHRAPLHALALRMLGHAPQAQDAVQDAFLIALRSNSNTEQINESPCKVLWYNLCVLVQAMHELGIEPAF